MTQPSMGTLREGVAAPYDFSIGDVLSEAWQRVHGMKAAAWGAILIIFLVNLAFGLVNYFLEANDLRLISVLVQIISVIVVFPLSVGLSYLGVRRSVDLPVRSNIIFSMYNFWKGIFGLFLLQIVIIYFLVFISVILFFVVGAVDSVGLRAVLMLIPIAVVLFTIYVSFSFIFAYLLLVEKRLGIWASLKASFWAFNQHWFKIIITLFLMIVLYFISILLLLVGIIWTLPMLVNLHGILYRIAFGVEEARGVAK